jgi:cytoskeleton protein RodZ
MTDELQQTTMTQQPMIPFGTRLQTIRETLGLERKDVAAQLRLNEKIIHMMEKDPFTSDLPVTFIRGYLRAYGRLLQIPEHETLAALEPIQHRPINTQPTPLVKPALVVTSGNYFMQLFTYLVIFTIIGLLGTWWYTHNTSFNVTDNVNTMINNASKLVNNQTTINAPVVAPTIVASSQPLSKPASAPITDQDDDDDETE